jgi:hypothetical protein
MWLWSPDDPTSKHELEPKSDEKNSQCNHHLCQINDPVIYKKICKIFKAISHSKHAGLRLLTGLLTYSNAKDDMKIGAIGSFTRKALEVKAVRKIIAFLEESDAKGNPVHDVDLCQLGVVTSFVDLMQMLPASLRNEWRVFARSAPENPVQKVLVEHRESGFRMNLDFVPHYNTSPFNGRVACDVDNVYVALDQNCTPQVGQLRKDTKHSLDKALAALLGLGPKIAYVLAPQYWYLGNHAEIKVERQLSWRKDKQKLLKIGDSRYRTKLMKRAEKGWKFVPSWHGSTSTTGGTGKDNKSLDDDSSKDTPVTAKPTASSPGSGSNTAEV